MPLVLEGYSLFFFLTLLDCRITLHHIELIYSAFSL